MVQYREQWFTSSSWAAFCFVSVTCIIAYALFIIFKLRNRACDYISCTLIAAFINYSHNCQVLKMFFVVNIELKLYFPTLLRPFSTHINLTMTLYSSLHLYLNVIYPHPIYISQNGSSTSHNFCKERTFSLVCVCNRIYPSPMLLF